MKTIDDINAAHAAGNLEGIHLGLDSSLYAEGPGYSQTSIKKALRSLMHWKFYDDSEDGEDSAALKFGRLFHKYALERDVFDNCYVGMQPHWVGQTNKAKEAKADYLAANPGIEIYSEKDMAHVKGMAAAIKGHSLARQLLNVGSAEVCAWLTHPEIGGLIKTRTDRFGRFDGKGMDVLKGKKLSVELKTCEDARPAAFAKDCAKWGYHIQGALDLDILSAFDVELEGRVWVCIEKKPPYGICVNLVDHDGLLSGKRLYERGLRLLAEAENTGKYPGYSMQVNTVSIPPWADRDWGGQ